MKKEREGLIAITIGDKGRDVDPARKAAVFKNYIQKALPNADIGMVEPISTSASLNSVCAYVDIAFEKGNYVPAFAKVHIESRTQSSSVLGAEDEYSQANLLAENGWPVLLPIASSNSKDYPLLIYPRVEAETLFELLEKSCDKEENLVSPAELNLLTRLNIQVGDAMLKSARLIDSKTAGQSPVQTLFGERLKKTGRIGTWYKPDTKFALSETDEPINWKKLLDIKWVINGEPYDLTLSKVIENARRYLSFDGEQKALACISHGDDHAGNIFIDTKNEKAIIFDPAFAGWNPASLSNVKALAHNCVLPMGGMYYNPKIGKVSYKQDVGNNIIYVDMSVNNSVLYGVHEALAKRIIDSRILPLFKKAKQEGINTENEYNRTRYSLATCAFLTTNVANLLKQNDGRGQGLLPLAIMLAELKGLPALDYLKDKLSHEL